MPQHLSIGDWFELDIADGRATIRGECDLATASRIQPWLAIFDGHPLDIDLSAADSMMGQPLPATIRIEARIDSDGDPLTKNPSDPHAVQDGVATNGSKVSMALQ